MALDHFLEQAGIVAGTSVLVLLACHRLRIPPVVALLATGVLIGPSGLGWIGDLHEVEVFAEIGVVLLLFAIGLELSFDRLRELRRGFFVGGGSQALLTAGVTTAVALAFGFSGSKAVFYGFLVVLSSTAVVLKLYGDRRELATPQGEAVMAILLLQDVLIAPMIVLTPVLGGEVEASAWALFARFGGGLLAVAAMFLAGRYLLPRALHQMVRTRSREVFVLGALGACLGMAWLTHHLGFSLALGAFLAGILISESEYSHQVVADVVPFRDVFASVFFVSIGMLVDLGVVLAHPVAVLALALAIPVVKALLATAAVRLLGMPTRVALIAGLGLAQIGEFSFVLMEVGREHGLLQGDRFQILLAAAVITLVLTPALVQTAPRLAHALTRRLPATPEGPAAEGLDGHVVVVGYGQNGRLLSRVLREAGIPYRILELNGETVRAARRDGEPIVYGDATRREILEHVAVERARVVVFAISDVAAVRRSVSLARQLHPGVEIVVRTRQVRDIEELRRLGADQVVAEEFETAIEIFTRVLRSLHVPRNVIRAQTRVLRGEGYRMLRAPALEEGVSEAVLDALAAGTTDIYRLAADHPAVGRTLRQLDLRRRAGASVIAVVRGEVPNPNPSADLQLDAGDCLVLVGSHAEIDRAFDLLGGPVEDESPAVAGDRGPASTDADRD